MKLIDVGLVALGSGLGGAARYALGGAISARWPSSLPLGTLAVNVSGCFLLGVLATALGSKSEGWRLLLGVGFCGGYTTFSTLMLDSARLRASASGSNLLLSLALGALALWLGTRLGSLLASR